MTTANRSQPIPTGGMRGPVAMLASGSAAAFIIGYVAKLVLLRLYGPADFGIFDFTLSLVGILIPIASLRYEDAVVLPEDDSEARDLLELAAWLTAAFVVVVALLVPVGHVVLLALGMPDTIPWLWTVPLVLLVMRISKLAELWLTRRERFARLATGNVAQAGVMTLVRIAAGLFRPGPGGLIGGFAVGQTATALLYGTATVRDVRRIPRSIQSGHLRAVATRYRKFALFSTPATLVSALVTRLPFLVLLYFFSAEVVGYFGQAFNILYVPISLLAAAVGQVFFVRAAQAVRADDLPSVAGRVHDKLVLIALFPVLTTAVAGPDVFAVLFGETWRVAGQYAGWIGAWILFTSIGSQLTRLFDVLQRQRTDLLVTLLLLAATVTALVIGGRSGDATWTMILLGVLGAGARLVQILVALRSAGVPYARIGRPYLREGVFAIPAASVIFWVTGLGRPLVTTLVHAVLLSSYALYVIRRERLFDRG